MIKKFKVNVSIKTLNNIYKKVREFPFNDIQQMNGWLHGTNHAYLKKISKYWTSKFNWKLQEKKINKFNNYITNVDGINIHFIKQMVVEKNQIHYLFFMDGLEVLLNFYISWKN